MKRLFGFTLMEVLIAIAIIAILAAIAYPSYLSYVSSARRDSAKSALLDLAGKEMKYYSTNNTFTTSLTDLGFSTADSIDVPDSNTTYYTISVTTNDDGSIADGFLATATPTGAQANDTCGALTVDEAGNKTPTTSGCW